MLCYKTADPEKLYPNQKNFTPFTAFLNGYDKIKTQPGGTVHGILDELKKTLNIRIKDCIYPWQNYFFAAKYSNRSLLASLIEIKVSTLQRTRFLIHHLLKQPSHILQIF